MTSKADGSVMVAQRGAVRTLTLNRPEKRNALDWETWRGLLAALLDAATAEDTRVVVLTGAGTAFCAGADLTGKGPDLHPYEHMSRINEVVTTLHRLPKVTIARVHGDAVGAGANLALACDLVIASDRSRFSEIFVRRGLSIDCGGSWILPRLVGLHRAKELCLTGDLITGEQAVGIGLVNRCVAEPELDAEVNGLIERLLACAPVAQLLTKRLLNDGCVSSLEQALHHEAAAQVVNVGSDDLREAKEAFVERRQPIYSGRWL